MARRLKNISTNRLRDTPPFLLPETIYVSGFSVNLTIMPIGILTLASNHDLPSQLETSNLQLQQLV
jgi:hypothetical protein